MNADFRYVRDKSKKNPLTTENTEGTEKNKKK